MVKDNFEACLVLLDHVRFTAVEAIGVIALAQVGEHLAVLLPGHPILQALRAWGCCNKISKKT